MTDTIIINQMSALGREILKRKRQRAQISGAAKSTYRLQWWHLTGEINKLARSA